MLWGGKMSSLKRNNMRGFKSYNKKKNKEEKYYIYKSNFFTCSMFSGEVKFL